MEPAVFISSTCYDLGETRATLKSFFESLGLHPLLSEFNSFPLNPDIGTVENCVDVVRRRADLFVLIVGGRYGTPTDSGKSITNLEYLEARAKGIPIYTFVSKAILHTLPVWRNNRDGNFAGVVDCNKLFEFVEALYSAQEQWVYPFERAVDITTTLRAQFAVLFKDALAYRGKFKEAGLPPSLTNLSPRSLCLVIEKEKGWENLLFSQIFAEEIESSLSLKRDLTYNLCLKPTLKLPNALETMDWITKKIGDLTKLANSASTLMNTAFQEAAGPPGKPGNAEHIVYVAQRVGELYRSVIRWTIEFVSVESKEELQPIIEIASRFSRAFLGDIEEYSERLRRELPRAINPPADQTEPVNLVLTLSAPPVEEFEKEAERLEQLYRINVK